MTASSSRIPIILAAPAAPRVVRRGEPVRLGVPCARGVWPADARFVLANEAGVPVPVQTHVLDRWGDGSIRWLLVDLRADHPGAGETTYWLAAGQETSAHHGARRDAIGDAITVGAAGSAAKITLHVEDERGVLTLALGSPVVEADGELRAVIRQDGSARREGDRERLQIVTRVHVFPGLPAVRVDVTLRNPRAAAHPGGYWELGDAHAVMLRDVAVTVSAGPQAEWSCSLDAAAPLQPIGRAFEIYQASSGGDQWQSRNHVDRHGRVPLPFRGFRQRAAGREVTGHRATPIVSTAGTPATVAVSIPDFWQNFPKAIDSADGTLHVRLFPRQHEAGHELQPGEQKTHTFYVSFGADPITDLPLEWTRSPLTARTTPEQYCGSAAERYLVPLSEEPHAGYAALVQAAIDGADAFEQKRERADEYGWRHFGDMYADHEHAYYTGPQPIVSHYNNQYDAVAGLARQFMRSGDHRWWRQMCALAAHVRDIDIYHTVEDKAAYNGGLFWHTAHYMDAGRATHRTYPRSPGVHGGGPSAEHNYASGLALHYFMTGDVASRDAAIGLARWVIGMDDGRRTVFRWLARGHTGVASATFSHRYHGPGRGAGHSIAALLDGYRLSQDRTFLEKAEALIRRCIHPADDPVRLDLLNIEGRWSYTVFLHVLGRYLDLKADIGQIDLMYRYAQRSLCAYAAWMATAESPYLDRRDELEYPTETWAAQELWKNEAFLYAARHDPDRRELFLERARFFFDYAVRTLASMPTRTYTRPLVLLLSRGLMQGYFALRPEALQVPSAADDLSRPLPAPTRFVPQKVVAMRRAVMLAAGGALTIVAALAVWLF